MNVADDCTRGIEIRDLTPESRWISGPEFLTLPEEQWPSSEDLLDVIVDDCLHCRKRRVKPSVPMMASLPKERLALCEPPFTNASVDYFGTMYVRKEELLTKDGDVSSPV